MGTGSEQGHGELERWLELLRRAWGIDDAAGMPALEELLQSWYDPLIATPESAFAGAAQLRRWREQLPADPPIAPSVDEIIGRVNPLAGPSRPLRAPGTGPRGVGQPQARLARRGDPAVACGGSEHGR
ncbi:MAG: hypothetical protein U5L11_13775 [Arhodomonas sp.]|nr:hypothetical protein [Arhodomonas sp.]